MNTQSILLVTVVGIVLAAALIDWRSRRIPNILSLGGAFAGLALHTVFFGAEGALAALGGWAVGFALLMPGYLLKQVGAGDVKLMAAAGTFMGPLTTFYAGVASMLIGAALALLIAIFTGGTRPWARYANMLRCLVVTGRAAYVPPQSGEVMARGFPYGVAIAAGCLLAVGGGSL